MNANSAHQSNWAIAEVVFGVPFLIGLGLQFVFPFSFPPGIVHKILIPIGVVMIVISIGLIVLSRLEFRQHDQPTNPGHPTSKLINTWVLSISRNPLYLGSAIYARFLASRVSNCLIVGISRHRPEQR
jgi:protein-S-isoprenylcysteine O-methyltransferase Ste14